MTKPPKAKPGPGPGSDGGALPVPNIADRGVAEAEHMSRGALALSTGLLSHVPYWGAKASNVFGIGSEHPFANYWTCEGGLREVVSVLPDKMQADALVSRYFECVDPVYPLVHRQTFYADYEQFWSVYMRRRADGAAAAAAAAAGTGSDGGGKGQGQGQDDDDADASFVALILVMLAMGTQFIPSTPPAERKQTAEFYASASNQALRVFSYLSNTSLRSIQAMVLITYFLINDNHASDGWAFAGVLIRQAYAMGLHRDPNIGTFCLFAQLCLELQRTSLAILGNVG